MQDDHKNKQHRQVSQVDLLFQFLLHTNERIPPHHNESTVGHCLPHSGEKFLLDMMVGGGGAHNIDGDYLLFDALFGWQVGSSRIGDIIGLQVGRHSFDII